MTVSFPSPALTSPSHIGCFIGWGCHLSTTATFLGGHPMTLVSAIKHLHYSWVCTLSNISSNHYSGTPFLGCHPYQTIPTFSCYPCLINVFKTRTTWMTLNKFSHQQEMQTLPALKPQLLGADTTGKVAEGFIWVSSVSDTGLFLITSGFSASANQHQLSQ